MHTTVHPTEPEGFARSGSFWLKAVLQGGVVLALAATAGLLFNGLRPAGLPLVQDWTVAAQLAAARPGESVVISMEDARALFYARAAVFIDARPRDFYEMGHIQGARSLPWEDFDSLFPGALEGIPPDAALIVYCDGEVCSLSKDLALALSASGYLHVQVLLNGWSVWQAAGMPTEEGNPPENPQP